MYSNINYYLLNLKKNLNSDYEIYEFIKKSFPEIKVNPVKGSYFNFNLSLFSHVCYPVSVPALASVLGPHIKVGSSATKKTRMVNRGVLKVYNSAKQDMGGRVAYYLSASGYNELFAQLPSYMCEKVKVRRTGGELPVHDYGTGLSILQCMLLERPFAFDKEVCYSNNLYKGRGALCVDAVVAFEDGNRERIYIEQDTGSEPPLTLIKKLACYDAFGLLLGEHNRLIISSHAVGDFAPCESFNINAMTRMLSEMKERGANKVFDFFMEHRKEFDEKMGVAVRAFLLRTGICFSENSGGGLLDPSHVTPKSFMKRNVDVRDFSIEDLERYISTLQDGSNEYRMMDYNKRQVEIARSKMLNMAHLVIRWINVRHLEYNELRFLLNGFSCYVLPTVLMSNYFSDVFEERMEDIRYSLSPYFESISEAAFQKYSANITYKNYPLLRLRNCFKLPNGKNVCVENISHDVGGYVRAYYFRTLYELGTDMNTVIVCICDSEDDAMELANDLKYYRYSRDLSEEVNLTFLLRDDIGKKNSLKVSSDLGTGGLFGLDVLYNIPDRVVPEETSSPAAMTEEDFSGMSLSDLLKMV